MNQTIAQTTERPEEIFNLDFTHAGAGHDAKAAPSAPYAEKTGKSPLDHIANLKTIHLVALVVVAMIGALAWMHLRHRLQPAVPRDSQYIRPNAAVEADRLPPRPQATNGTPAPPRASDNPTLGTETAAETSDAIASPAEHTDDRERAMIRRALEDLNARLSILEGQSAAQEQKARLAQGIALQSTAHRKRTPTASVRSEAESRANTTVLAGYSINTIFNDQAWIDHDGRTFVVQAGDHIGDVRILNIDAHARRVLTPNGAIK